MSAFARGSASTAGFTKEETCKGVQPVHNRARKAEKDLALGDLDLGQTLVSAGQTQAQISILAERGNPPELREAIARWRDAG